MADRDLADSDRPSSALVDAELDRLAASQAFRRAARHLRFLRHLIDLTLAGDLARLREIALGIEVFMRAPARFDPRSDTIVRVEARRLRQKLERYYAEEGVDARLEFQLPVGGYAITFRRRHDELAARQRISVAVLPLQLEGEDGDAALQALAPALASELVAALTRLNGLRVVAAREAAAPASAADARRAAQGLGVHNLVLGRLMRMDGELNLQLALLHGDDGKAAWQRQATFDRSQALEALEPLARGIVAVLHREAAQRQLQRIRLAGSRPLLPALSGGGPTADGMDKLNLAKVAMRSNAVDGYRKAVVLAEEAVALMPLYAPAFSTLAQALFATVGITVAPPEPTVEAARQAAERALELDAESADAHVTLGQIHFAFDRDWPRAESSMLSALRLAPASAGAHAAYGFGLITQRRFDEARSAYAEARDLDAMSLLYRVHATMIDLYEHRYEPALQALGAVLEIAPQHLIARALQAAAELYRGNADAALEHYRELQSAWPKLSIGRCGIAQALAMRGDLRAAEHELALLVAAHEAGWASPYQIAMVHARMQRAEPALHWLGEAARMRDYNYVVVAADPTFDALRASPGYKAMLRSTGLAHLVEAT